MGPRRERGGISGPALPPGVRAQGPPQSREGLGVEEAPDPPDGILSRQQASHLGGTLASLWPPLQDPIQSIGAPQLEEPLTAQLRSGPLLLKAPMAPTALGTGPSCSPRPGGSTEPALTQVF